MATSKDLMFQEYPLVVRDVTAAQFAAQNVPPPHPGVIYRVDGASSYQWNGSSWVPYVMSTDNITGLSIKTLWVGTQAQYDAIAVKDANTQYNIVEA